MTNVERVVNNLNSLLEIYKEDVAGPPKDDIQCAILIHISCSLASIADSLERLAPREYEDPNR